MILQRLFDRQQTAAMIWQLSYRKKLKWETITVLRDGEGKGIPRRLKIVKWTNLGSLSMSRSLPFFFQKMVGDGVPLGAAQIKRAVPPLTTPVSSGSSQNLSLKTGKNVRGLKV